MRIVRSVAYALGAALLVGTAPAAHAAVDETVTRALELHRGGRPADAYALLSPLVDARAGDPDFDYALGIAAIDSGRPGEAIVALQRVIAVQPNNGPARAEIARAYALAGDIDTARAEFDTVVADPTVPDPVRQRLNRLVRDYDRQIAGGGRAVEGFADAEIGWDSNINSATSLGSITLPVFAFLGPATLGGGATRIDDGYYQLQGGLSASTGLSRQTRAYISALGTWRDNFESRAFDQAALTGTAGISHSFANQDVLSLSGQVQQFWLGRNRYRTSVGAIGQYTHRLSGGSALAFAGQYYRLDYRGDPARDADRFAGTITWTGRTTFAGLGGGRERTVRRTADNLSFTFLSAQAGTEYPLGDRLALTGGFSIEHRDYDGADPLFLRGRKDTQVDSSLGFRYALGGGLSVRPRLTFTRNWSNLDLYDYRRITAAVGIRAEF